MPDTGAPWNIPYADPTDLVRDWPSLSEDVAEAVADGLDAAGGLKDTLSIVQTANFDTSSGTYVDVTDFFLDITPTSTASKIVVLCSFTIQAVSDAGVTNSVQLVRESTALLESHTAILVSSGNRQVGALVFLDSPSTTSTIRYKVEAKTNNGARGCRVLSRSLVIAEVTV